MRFLRTLRNYLCYCGIEKDEYNAVKKEAYVSNFKVWRVLHCFIAVVFAALLVTSLFDNMLAWNRMVYLFAFIYYAGILGVFFALKKDSIIAQLLIYLSISVLFLFGAFITSNKPEYPATTFIVALLITPMFMIDKPYFMGIELGVASTVFLIWMHAVKSPDIFRMDVVNIAIFSVSGFVVHTIANSLRIKEFVLTRRINIQKDLDDLTGLKNKGALTRQINEFLSDPEKEKGILFMLDVDRFKSINDTYGHDVGDSVISQLGSFLGAYFKNGEIVGRFGGDEFIFFIKDTDDTAAAAKTANEIIAGSSERIELPDKDRKITVSIGIAVYRGQENNYSEIFKKADSALYAAKADPAQKYKFYE